MNALTSAFRRDRWIPWAFVGGFAVVILANAALLSFALSTWTGITAQDAFHQTEGYNRELAEARAQATLGWRVDPRFEATGERAGRLVVAASAPDGTPLTGAIVRATFARPTIDGLDFPAGLAPEGAGSYAAPVTFPLAGQWDVNIVVDRGGQTYRLVRRLFVRE